MATIRTSAPGKLFLLGEYAVLEGAPAMLTAVDRRVTVSITTSDRWRVTAVGLPGGDGERYDSGQPRVPRRHGEPEKVSPGIELGPDGELPASLGTREREALRVFDAVRYTVLTGGGRFAAPLDILIDSSALSRDGHKLGLGSSAAVASALTLGLRTAAGLPSDPDSLGGAAMAAHRLAQNGTGSGGDVAASVYGGFLDYSTGGEPTPLDWPAQVQIMTVVTGTGASTTDLVGRVRSYAAAEPESYEADLAKLRRLAEHARHALSYPSRLLRLASDYFTALATLDDHAQAGIVTETHRRLHAVAARAGGVFKTSGAGGGDVGLAFAHRGEAAERLADALTAAGAEIVPLSYGEAGVREDSE